MNDWRTLLASALLAPSPHNVQPWRVRIVDPRHAELLIEKRRTLPREDVTGSFIILTMGLFVETLRLAAAHRGLAVDEELAHEPAWYRAEHLETMDADLLPFAGLTLRPAPDTAAEYALDLLSARRTSRLHYRAEPVSEDTALRLDALARSWGQGYAQIHEPERIERLLRWNVDAVFADLNHPPYHDELASWIRYTEAESTKHRDGLDARCMNQKPLELWTAFRLPGLLRLPIARSYFRRRYRRQIGPVATLGFLSGPFWDPAAAYREGRFLIRFWLEVTRAGYYIHPYGNLVTHRPTAARVEEDLGIRDIWLAFKIGRSDPPPASRRRDLDEVLV